MRRTELAYTARGGWVALRRLTGHDEESIEEVSTAGAIALVDRLLVAAPGAALGPGEAARLTAADRDRILADLHVAELGAKVESTLACGACGTAIDVDFQLPALLAAAERDTTQAVDEEGTALLPDGRRIRLPTGADELAVAAAADPEAELLRRCSVDGTACDAATAAAALERVAPLLDVDLDAACPECGAATALRFDAQEFVLERLLADRDARTREVHSLARAYHWPLHEILGLSRQQRKLHVALVDSERAMR